MQNYCFTWENTVCDIIVETLIGIECKKSSTSSKTYVYSENHSHNLLSLLNYLTRLLQSQKSHWVFMVNSLNITSVQTTDHHKTKSRYWPKRLFWDYMKYDWKPCYILPYLNGILDFSSDLVTKLMSYEVQPSN